MNGGMAAGQAGGPRPTPRNGRSLATMKAGRIRAAARKPTGAASWTARSTRPGPRQGASPGAASGEPPAPRSSSRCRLTATVPSLREAFCDEIPEADDDFMSRFAGYRIDAGDRKRVVSGKRVSVRVDLGGGRNIKKQKDTNI